MNILINCSNLKIGGGIQVAHSFLDLIKNEKGYKFFIVLSDFLKCQIDLGEYDENFKFYYYNIPYKLNVITGIDFFLDNLICNYNVDVVFSIFGPTYWHPKVRHIVGYAKPHYVYSDSPYFKIISFKERILLSIKRFFHLRDFKNNSDILITENEDVTKKLKVLFPKKNIYTVTNFYNQIFDFPEKWDRSLNLPNFDGFTLLTVSANYPHKNLKIILHVAKFFISNHKNFKFRFILTVEKDQFPIDYFKEVEEHIVFLGNVNILQVPYLYSKVDAVFLPSLLECFTATYPEAMRMEKPILTSDLDFARSLCNNSACYFKPLDPIDISNKILLLVNDVNLKFKLVDFGLKRLSYFDDYKMRAKKYMEIIKK
ncbi:Glycosyltransferase involved in cell wall bisynthesis [Algoriphagus ornithinivorans]|uniref:Glycosyltransferase involved in cell wall bisynthesis n=1 Tax=Algoriphagus ornithinivorans TaxID=226506 RepID=A0A1I5JNZ9_9BACT|nr:glycosyltransferase [Algoriphagus ornithinivorans]SFO74141.1 Glycosyltransferase involved in cell wall bisynthesis [Algoriphagus ornithinivorans]